MSLEFGNKIIPVSNIFFPIEMFDSIHPQRLFASGIDAIWHIDNFLLNS